MKQYGLPYTDASQLISDRSLGDYFESAAEASGNTRGASNWIRSELLRELEVAGLPASESPIAAAQLGALVRLIDDEKISGKQGKDVLVEMFKTGKTAESIIEEKGLVQVSDTVEIDQLIDSVIEGNPDQLASYRGGKETLFGFFVGQVIKASKGKANPKVVNERLRAKLQS
jgi:aspartyl-tRNA(Asn)/glutamyl-tRNA(Gln) amidotransferase subunit B